MAIPFDSGGCLAGLCGDGLQSICTARPQSSVDQSYQRSKNSRPPRQGQSAHCYYLKMRKFDMAMPTKPTVKSGNEVEATAGSEGSGIVLETSGIHRVCQGRLGLGNCKTKCWSKAKSTCSVVQRVREATEDQLLRAVGFASQEQWHSSIFCPGRRCTRQTDLPLAC